MKQKSISWVEMLRKQFFTSFFYMDGDSYGFSTKYSDFSFFMLPLSIVKADHGGIAYRGFSKDYKELISND